MNLSHNLGLLLHKNRIGANLGSKSKNLCTAGLRLFEIIDSDLTNLRF